MVMTEGPTTHSIDDGNVRQTEWDAADDSVDADPDTPTQTSPEHQNTNGDGASKPLVPMQKRRRVTRACDECRRKKIKCDGKQPCTHCTVYSYECTYDQPSNRRRNAAPQYIDMLEKRVKRMEGILSILLPNVDCEDPTLEARLRSGLLPQRPIPATNGVPATQSGDRKANVQEPSSDSQLESMVRATGQLDLDEEGYWDYHGHSSGLSFVRRMREQFPDIITELTNSTPFIKSRPLSHVFESPKQDSPRSHLESPVDGQAATADLPPKEEARAIVERALNDAASLLRAVHEPTIWKAFERIYEKSPDEYNHDDQMFLPLLYAILALGSLFSTNGRDIDSIGYAGAIDQGVKYFKAARSLMDVADCRDIRSLQAIVFFILFLQSSAKLSTCYCYIGVALRSALRMGLHRSFEGNFNPIENETRKRMFWVIRKMDIYVGALLGLPHTMNDDDIDQELPEAVDDEFITETEILPMPEGRTSVIAASNAHTKLVLIIARIVKVVYPLKSNGPRTANSEGAPTKYSVGYGKIRELELELQDWQSKLPAGLRPGGEAPKIILRVQQLLRMAYAHAQMMLYRPFLHYVSSSCKQKMLDKRAYACAAACVSVSRNIVHINSEMKKRGLLNGAHWFSMYTGFFAILSLVYFALENPDSATSQDILRDAREGKDTLAELARRSMAADRCSSTLNVLFEQLPERIKRGRAESLAKKRRHDASPHPLALQDRVSTDNMVKSASTLPEVPRPRRASTFNGVGNNEDSKPPSKTIPLTQAQLNLDSPYTYASTPGLVDSSSTMTASPAQASMPYGIGNPGGGSSISSLANGFHGIPMSPAVMSNYNDLGISLPDMTSMMFPSADPFAYPNQPTSMGYGESDFDTKDLALFQHNDSSGDSLQALSGVDQYTGQPSADVSHNGTFVPSSAFIPRNTSQAAESDLELFGPVDMYQMQGVRHSNAPLFTDPFAAGIMDQGPVNPHRERAGLSGEQVGQNGVTGMNLDEMFGGEEWNDMFNNNGSLNPAGRGEFGANGASFR